MTTCEDCGRTYGVGQWYDCPHDFVQPRKGFEPYIDHHIAEHPVLISNPGDKAKHLKPHWKDDHIVHMQERR